MQGLIAVITLFSLSFSDYGGCSGNRCSFSLLGTASAEVGLLDGQTGTIAPGQKSPHLSRKGMAWRGMPGSRGVHCVWPLFGQGGLGLRGLVNVRLLLIPPPLKLDKAKLLQIFLNSSAENLV